METDVVLGFEPETSQPLLKVRHVAKLFRSADGSSRVAVLDDIDLDIEPGEVVALLGRRPQALEETAAIQEAGALASPVPATQAWESWMLPLNCRVLWPLLLFL